METQEADIYSQFVSQKIRKVKFLKNSNQPTKRLPESFVAGSWDDFGENAVAFWKITVSEQSMKEENEIEDRFKFQEITRRRISSDISDIQ